MAKKWTNLNLPGALHFVTGNVLNRSQIFRIAANCRSFLDNLQALRNERQCKLIAFVIMLDHFHLILNPRDGDIQTSIGILKSFTAKSLVQLAP
jgi:REP element-mobilizing transposase RayT